MIFRDQAPDTAPVGTSVMAVGALVGVALGVGSLWATGQSHLLLGAAAIVVGFCAALWRPPFGLTILTATTALLAALVSGLIANASWAGALLGLVRGSIYTLCLIVPILIITAVRGRRSYLQRGWTLAIAEAREHDARVDQAVTRERDAMASEIHDGLGHRLTLIAVQAARLSLDQTLPAPARAELDSIRANAAAASDELGHTVRLLGERSSELTASLTGLRIDDVVDRARSSGLQVESTIAENIENGTNDYSRSALLRALQEGLTNAAKHAPDTKVHVDVGAHEDWLELRVSNPVPGAAVVPPASGRGIIALQHRIAILGGEMTIEQDEKFTLTVRLPRSAAPSQAATASPSTRAEVITAEDLTSASTRRRTAQVAWLVPTGLLATALLSALGYFIVANVASVLAPERFAAIEVGASQQEVETVLPSLEMLDAPTAALPPPSGATCQYYEASISFFDRDDVFRICFANNQVASTDTIPAA